jgi:hypothetical protein
MRGAAGRVLLDTHKPLAWDNLDKKSWPHHCPRFGRQRPRCNLPRPGSETHPGKFAATRIYRCDHPTSLLSSYIRRRADGADHHFTFWANASTCPKAHAATMSG